MLTTDKQAIIYGIRLKDGDVRYIYVGSTLQSLKSRFNSHLSSLRKNKHWNSSLSSKAAEFGIDNLIAEVIECVDEDLREAKEFEWIQYFLNLGHELTNVILDPSQYAHLIPIQLTSVTELPKGFLIKSHLCKLFWKKGGFWGASFKLRYSDGNVYNINVNNPEMVSVEYHRFQRLELQTFHDQINKNIEGIEGKLTMLRSIAAHGN